MAYTTNAASLDLAKLQENIATLQKRKAAGTLTAQEKIRLQEYTQRVGELQAAPPVSTPPANSQPAAGNPALNTNVTDAARAAEVAAELQRRIDADKATANDKARLADLQVKFPTTSAPPTGDTGTPATGTPATGTPATGTPATGTPATGNSTSPTTDTIPNPNGTPGLTPEDISAIERTKALLGIGETFGRSIADEFYKDGSLGRIDETLSPDQLAAQEQIKRFAANAGNQSQQVKDLINQQQGILNNAQQLSDIELEALGLSRDALAGLDAPEMEALRSAARQNIQGQYQAEARQLSKAQARSQNFGASATAQRGLLGQGAVKETRNLERDLLIKNIDIKQAALNSFTNLVSQTEGARANRTNAASGQLAGTIIGDEGQRNNAQIAGNQQYANTANQLKAYLDSLKEFNLTQAASEKAGQIGSIFGGIGTITDQTGLLRGEDFAKQQAEAAEAARKRIEQIIQDSLKKTNQTAGV